MTRKASLAVHPRLNSVAARAPEIRVILWCRLRMTLNTVTFHVACAAVPAVSSPFGEFRFHAVSLDPVCFVIAGCHPLLFLVACAAVRRDILFRMAVGAHLCRGHVVVARQERVIIFRDVPVTVRTLNLFVEVFCVS